MSGPTAVELQDVEKHLVAQGYRVVARGYSTRWGKLDFVCRDGAVLAFVQVRDARKAKPGKGEREALVRAAAWFLGDKGWWHFRCRFDAVTVEGDPPQVRVMKDAWS